MSFLFNRFAFVYDSFMKKAGLATENELVKLLGDIHGLKAADIGGGTGTLSVMLAEANVDVSIIDPCKSMTSIARNKMPAIRVIDAYAENIPVEDGAFDLVCMKDSLHHIENQEKALQEAVRVLKSGGRLAILEFNLASMKSKFIYIFERLCGEKTRLVKPESLSNFLNENGVQGKVVFLNALEYVFVGYKNGENGTLL